MSKILSPLSNNPSTCIYIVGGINKKMGKETKFLSFKAFPIFSVKRSRLLYLKEIMILIVPFII